MDGSNNMDDFRRIEEKAAELWRKEDKKSSEDAKDHMKFIFVVYVILLVAIAIYEIVKHLLFDSSLNWRDFALAGIGLFVMGWVSSIFDESQTRRRVQQERLIRVEMALEFVLKRQDDLKESIKDECEDLRIEITR